jgi:uncharacterized protein YcaQ
MHAISLKAARRLALARAGLLPTKLSGLPARAAGPRGRGKRTQDAIAKVIDRFGYLQLDTISVAGARTQSIVLCSRLAGMDASLAEELLQPGQPYFEYWGHEACWLPMSMYPYFEFRRQEFRVHPWWGDIITANRKAADALLARIRDEGPLRSMELEEEPGVKRSSEGWWETKLSKRIAEALWSSGELAIRERRNFHRIFDLAERVIPAEVYDVQASDADSMDTLLLRALAAHGWATTGTLAATWRLRNRRPAIQASLERLHESGVIAPCELHDRKDQVAGWIRTQDLETAALVESYRLHALHPVLLSPFDPVLWDRARVARLFGFEQVLEIYKPQPIRQYGYYCLPVLSGEWLVGRVDLKSHRQEGRLEVRAWHREKPPRGKTEGDVDEAVSNALQRYATSVGLELGT